MVHGKFYVLLSHLFHALAPNFFLESDASTKKHGDSVCHRTSNVRDGFLFHFALTLSNENPESADPAVFSNAHSVSNKAKLFSAKGKAQQATQIKMNYSHNYIAAVHHKQKIDKTLKIWEDKRTQSAVTEQLSKD